MPVPVTVTNPDGKGTRAHQNRSLPSTGGLFSNLGTASAEAGLKAQQAVQAQKASVDTKPSTGFVPEGNKPDTDAEEISVEVRSLEFKWTGDDGLPMSGAFTCGRAPRQSMSSFFFNFVLH